MFLSKRCRLGIAKKLPAAPNIPDESPAAVTCRCNVAVTTQS